jgi:hypothetical protein
VLRRRRGSEISEPISPSTEPSPEDVQREEPSPEEMPSEEPPKDRT